MDDKPKNPQMTPGDWMDVEQMSNDDEPPVGKIQLAINLAPGDVVLIGHVHVFIVGVRLQEYCPPTVERTTLSVLLAGAPCKYTQNDWSWLQKNVMYDSPWLLFNAEDEVIVVRPSPTKCSTLQRFLETKIDASAAFMKRIAEELKKSTDAENTPPSSPSSDDDSSK